MRTTSALLLTALLVACSGDTSDAPTQDDAGASADTAVADTSPPEDTDPDTAASADTAPPDVPPRPDGPGVWMDHSRAAGFYLAPFPSESLRREDGGISMAGFPREGADIIRAMLDIVESDADGFGVSSAVYFQTTAPIDVEALGGLSDSVAPDAAAFLVNVDPESPRHRERLPVTSSFMEDGGPYGSPNQLALLPLQGVPLAEGALHAAVVTTRVQTTDGAPLEPSPVVASLSRGERPEGMSEAAAAAYQSALAELEGLGVTAGDVAGLAVFRTGRPSAGMLEGREAILAEPRPELERPWEMIETHPDYCVYRSAARMPVYQAGAPPFTEGGGGWARDAEGRLEVQRHEEARVLVTLPRRPMPAEGFPTALFVRTGGGGDRPLIDRGVRDETGEPIALGTGPAVQLAQAGYAGVSVDGPHGGARNITHGDEQFLIFNIANPLAMRDNVRQSAIELILMSHMLGDLRFDPSGCEGLEAPDEARLRGERVTLMGHSMGATIAPLALAVEPRFEASVLSGAGGSWIANIMYKLKPLETRPLAEILLGYQGRALHEHDPALTLLLWAGEPADPPIYAHRVIQDPVPGATARHVLMFQGIADTYILPPMANALTLSLGLDPAGSLLDVDHPVAGAFAGVEAVLPFSGRQAIALPASGNLADGAITGVVVQHPEGPIEDGHEVMFQTNPPKHQYRCFLQSLAADAPPRVPVGLDDATAPCVP